MEHLIIFDYFSIQLGISSSQLTKSIIFQRGRAKNHQPENLIHQVQLYGSRSKSYGSAMVKTCQNMHIQRVLRVGNP